MFDRALPVPISEPDRLSRIRNPAASDHCLTPMENPHGPERNPNDPYRANLADDPYLAMPGDQLRRQARLDNELQADPELAEGPASGGKIAMFAVAIAVVLGAVFYGLNNSSINQAGHRRLPRPRRTPPVLAARSPSGHA